MQTSFLSRILSIVFLCTLMACTPVPISQLYHGKTITDVQIIPLSGSGPQQGNWSTFDMVIDYQYQVENDRLHISGTGMLSQHYQLLYAAVRQLRVYLFLLDDSGRVKQTVPLSAFLSNAEDTFRFDQSVVLAPEIKAFSFGYSGYAYENEDQFYFDQLPN
ncbi:MAG: hypothetical protein P8Y73_11940 [Desulfuromonadales bacterium]